MITAAQKLKLFDLQSRQLVNDAAPNYDRDPSLNTGFYQYAETLGLTIREAEQAAWEACLNFHELRSQAQPERR